MNHLEAIVQQSQSAEQFARGYLEYLSQLLARLDTKAIAQCIEELEQARQGNHTVFVIGNGGSAATASHMANDFGVGAFPRDGAQPFRVLALTDNVAAMTAIGNDSGYDNLFVYQLRIHYRPGDTLIAISASGNSPNVVAAAEWVRRQGGTVIGLTGFDGGRLKALSKIALHAATPKGEYGPVEDVHMILDHLIFSWLRRQA